MRTKLFSPEHYPRIFLVVGTEADVVNIFPVTYYKKAGIGRVFTEVIGIKDQCKFIIRARRKINGFFDGGTFQSLPG
jgi:hypothetical protein